MLRFLCILGAMILAADNEPVCATVLPNLVRAPISIPVVLANGVHAHLDGLMVRPDRSGRFPLVILVHGTPRGTGAEFFAKIASQSPAALEEPSIAFAQRGYAAVSIMRRGFGHSDGPYAEQSGEACNDRSYLRLLRISGDDVRAAMTALQTEPWVDPHRVVLAGFSTGGMAVIAAGASNPAGLAAILNFAGGRGSYAPDQVCNPDDLVRSVGLLGTTARAKALWIYSENDHFFGPPLARRMFDAYTRSGAPAFFVPLPPLGEDGHVALLHAHDVWWPAVDKFLATMRLPTELVIEFPPLSDLPRPAPLKPTCGVFFSQYTSARTDAKAFARNPEGHCGYTTRARSVDEAKADAIQRCNDHGTNCELYAVGQDLVEGGR